MAGNDDMTKVGKEAPIGEVCKHRINRIKRAGRDRSERRLAARPNPNPAQHVGRQSLADDVFIRKELWDHEQRAGAGRTRIRQLTPRVSVINVGVAQQAVEDDDRASDTWKRMRPVLRHIDWNIPTALRRRDLQSPIGNRGHGSAVRIGLGDCGGAVETSEDEDNQAGHWSTKSS